MAADVEGAQRLLEELHRHSKDNFPDAEVVSLLFIAVAILRTTLCMVELSSSDHWGSR